MNSKLFYETQGTGQPLILIPGFTSGAWAWNWQTKKLAEDFQVVAFDPRGIGRSEADDADLQNLSMRVFAEDVRHILDELGIEKVNVLGASFGGFVAQEFAFSFPDRLDKLVLACTSFGGAQHVKPDIEILRSFTPDPALTNREQIRQFLQPAFTDEFNRDHPEVIEQVCRLREENDVAEAVYLAQLQTAFSFDFEDKLGAIDNQTLVITGNKDRVVPMENSVNLAQKIPNATLKIIKNGSHLFFVEQADEFNKIVADFVNG